MSRERSKTLYIHIGHYKTGTTAIQEFGTRNYEFLRAHGIHYCRSARIIPRSPTHGLYPLLAVREGGLPVPQWFNDVVGTSRTTELALRDLNEEINASDAKKFAISSEEFARFCGMPDAREQVGRLVAAFPACDVVVIAYLREPLAYYESWYNHLIKKRAAVPRFSEFWLDLPIYHADFLAMIEVWSDVVGMDRFILQDYSERGASHLLAFFRALGVDLDAEDVEARMPRWDVNQRLAGRYVELTRTASHVAMRRTFAEFLKRFDDPEYPEVNRDRIKERCGQLSRNLHLLADRYALRAAEQWLISANRVVGIERKVNRISSSREIDLRVKRALFAMGWRAGRAVHAWNALSSIGSRTAARLIG